MVLLGYQALATEFFFASLAGTFVSLRLYVRTYQQGLFNAGDAMCILAFALTVAGIASDCVVNHLGFWQDLSGMGMMNSMYMGAGIDKMWLMMLPVETLVKLCKIFYAQSLIYYTVLWLAKFVLLHLYYSLIPNSMRTLRMLLHFTAVFTVAGYVAAMCMSAFWCLPVRVNWTIKMDDPTGMCTAYSKAVPYYITLGLHLVAEALLCIIPIPLIRVLKLDNRKKYGLAFVFGLAALCILCTVAQRTKCTNMSGVDPAMGVWAAWEESCSIIVVCSPTLKCFLTNGVFKTIRGLRSSQRGDSKEGSESESGSGDVSNCTRKGKHSRNESGSGVTDSTVEEGCRCEECGQLAISGGKARRISSVFEIVRNSRLWNGAQSRRISTSQAAVEPKASTPAEQEEKPEMSAGAPAAMRIVGDMRSASDNRDVKKNTGEGFSLGAFTVSETPLRSPMTPLRDGNGGIDVIREDSTEGSPQSSVFMA